MRKGEKAAFVVFYKELEVAADPETGDAWTATRLFARATPVFAAEQVNGYQAPVSDAAPMTVITPIEQAEAFVAATGAAIHHGGGRAFYRPSTDSIHLPPRDAFINSPTSTPAESYYSTVCHELTHWTSAEPRCNRRLGKRFGDQAFAMEELVAELGAALLCADLRITDAPRTDHAQYLTSWLAVLKADKKAIFTAAFKASEATGRHSPAHRVAGDLNPYALGNHVHRNKRMGLLVKTLVLDRLRALLSSRTDVSETLAPLDLDAYALDAALRKALKLSERWLAMPPVELKSSFAAHLPRNIPSLAAPQYPPPARASLHRPKAAPLSGRSCDDPTEPVAPTRPASSFSTLKSLLTTLM